MYHNEQGPDDTDGVLRLRENTRAKHKTFYLQDTTSLDSVSISSQSEISEYQAPDTDIGVGSGGDPPLVGGSLNERAAGTADYFNGDSLQVDAETARACLSLPAHIPGSDFIASLTDGSIRTVDSGINMAASSDSSVVLRNGNTGGLEKPGVKQLPRVSLTLTTSNGEEEVDFERSWEGEDPGVEQRRKEALERGDWYRRHGSLVALESDSDSGEVLDETLKAEDLVELTDGVLSARGADAVSPTPYSKIEIVSAVSPASPSPELVSMATNSPPLESEGSTDASVGVVSTDVTAARANGAEVAASCVAPPTSQLTDSAVGMLIDLSSTDTTPTKPEGRGVEPSCVAPSTEVRSTDVAVGMLVDLSSTEEATPTELKREGVEPLCVAPPTEARPSPNEPAGTIGDHLPPINAPLLSSSMEIRTSHPDRLKPTGHLDSPLQPSQDSPASLPCSIVSLPSTLTSTVDCERHRSSSTCSPGVKKKKKPKPLPRRSHKLVQSVDQNGEVLREEVFTKSLPVEWMSAPPPPKFIEEKKPVHSEKMDEEEESPVSASSVTSSLGSPSKLPPTLDNTSPSTLSGSVPQTRGEDTSTTLTDVGSVLQESERPPPPPIPPPRRRKKRSSVPTLRGFRPQPVRGASLDKPISDSLPRSDAFDLSHDTFEGSHDLLVEEEMPDRKDDPSELQDLTPDNKDMQVPQYARNGNKVVLPESNPGLYTDSRGLMDYLDSISPPPSSESPDPLEPGEGTRPGDRGSSMIVNR